VAADLVQFVFAHFPILGGGSELIAQASECAGDQGRFWEFHDAFFEFSEISPNDAFSEEGIRTTATVVGVDTDRFNACLASGEMAERVELDHQFGLNEGVKSTPTMFINGQRLNGLRSYDEYENFILAALD